MDTIKLFNQRKDSNDELEVIISSSKNVALSLIEKLKEYTVFKYVDLWCKKDRLRLDLTSGKSEKIRKELVKTEKLSFNGMILHLKSEIKISDFNTKGIDRIRLKYVQRYEMGKWVLDISRIMTQNDLKEVPTFKNYLKEATSFDDPKINTFTSYEVELEYIGSDTLTYEDMVAVLKEVIGLISDQINAYEALEHLGTMFYQCTSRRVSLELKNLLPNVINVDRSVYKDIYDNMNDFYVTEKSDGFRCVIIGLKNTLYLLSDVSNKVSSCEMAKDFIIDGELCNDTVYVWDCLQYGKTLCDATFSERLSLLPEVIAGVKDCVKEYKLEMKRILPMSKENIAKVYKDKYAYKIDGLIITKKESKFFESPFKWKPMENLTIDFLVLKARNPLPSQVKHGHTMFYLYVGIRRIDFNNMGIFKDLEIPKITIKDRDYFPIPFATVRDPLLYVFNTNDSRIIDSLKEPCIAEFRQKIVNDKISGWEFLHVRKDRQELLNKGLLFGNNYNVAERIMEQYYIPLVYEDLIDFKSEHYFVKEKSRIHKANTRINGEIKRDIFKMGSGNLIDIGAGKGQNMKEYKAYFDNVLAIDKDNMALSEMITRLRSTDGQVNLKVLNIDIMEAGKELDPYKKWANMVTINFAIHYMINSIVDMLKLYNIINSMLKEGYFAFTCLNGAKVLEALEGKDKFEYFENNVLKYSIKHKVRNSEITLNKIEVLLPFSEGKFYTENLLDVNKVVKTFTDKGYELVKSEGFDKYLNDPKYGASEVDKKYGYLNHYVVLKKSL